MESYSSPRDACGLDYLLECLRRLLSALLITEVVSGKEIVSHLRYELGSSSLDISLLL